MDLISFWYFLDSVGDIHMHWHIFWPWLCSMFFFFALPSHIHKETRVLVKIIHRFCVVGEQFRLTSEPDQNLSHIKFFFLAFMQKYKLKMFFWSDLHLQHINLIDGLTCLTE